MRAGAVLSIALLASSLAGCSRDPETFDQARKSALEEEVRETLEGLTSAMNRHDSDQIFRYYRSGEEFLYLGCTEVLLAWEPFSLRVANYHRSNPEVVFEQEVLRVRVLSPTVAVAATRGSSTRAEALFWTQVLIKEGGDWTITYEHESWPGCPPTPAPHPLTMPSDSLGLLPPDTAGLKQ